MNMAKPSEASCTLANSSIIAVTGGLVRPRPAQLRVGERVTDRTALVPPAVEGVFPKQQLVPFAIASVLGRQAVDPVAPGDSGLPLAQDIGAGELALGLGLTR